MVQGNAILVVDLGNSCTKCITMFGKSATTGKYKEKRFDIPNVFAPINKGYEVSSDYKPATSAIISVETELNGMQIRGHYCNGELQAKEKPVSTIKPSAMEKKYNLESSVLSYNMAFLRACEAVMDITQVYDFKQLDLTWTVVTLLPPGDIDTGKEKITKMVQSIKEVNSVFPEAKIPINVREVHVLPEGFCAYVGVVYNKGNIFRPDYKFLTEETVLIFDIGAGTTDCLVIKDNKLVQSSKYTVTQGGNNVYQLVRKNLNLQGMIFDDRELMEGVVRGYVKDGAKKFSLVDLVNEAKEEIAQKLISEFQNFIEVTDLKMRSIGYVLICGGGSMVDSDADGIMPLSEKVIQSVKRQAVNCELVKIPMHTVQKEEPDGDVRTVEEPISPRDLNLIGASILAEVL